METSIVKFIQGKVEVVQDGIIGPKTKAAILNFGLDWVVNKTIGRFGHNRFEHELRSLFSTRTRNTSLVDSIIEIAKGEIGIVETSKNQGLGIAKYWEATSYGAGYKNREPYCAAAVCWILREALQGKVSFALPTTARAFGFEDWAKNNGLLLISSPVKIEKGDIVIFEFSHIGIAITNSNKNGIFQTVEANTSPNEKGSQRDGGGVHKRDRSINLVQSVIRI